MQGQIHEVKLQSRYITETFSDVCPDPKAFVYAPKNVSPDTPVVYVLAPWLSAGRAFLHWKPFRENFPERLDRLWSESAIPKCIAVFPDLFTTFGGSQYINSSYFGPHADFITDELVPEVDRMFGLKSKRYIMGRSSGGFGAMRMAMDKPGTFAGIACHSGDMGFEQMVRGDLTTLARGLDRYKGNIHDFIKYSRQTEKLSGLDTHLLMLLGTCGFYSPNPKSKWGYDLPVDLHTAQIDTGVWRQWLDHDPVNRIEGTQKNVEALEKFYLECGTKDQYNLLYGARQLHAKLKTMGIDHQYEEFDDNHSATDYRFDVSLRYLLLDK